MHISALHLYPVKSLRGFAVPAADIDELGFAGDRRFLVIDETGKFQTQRQNARMALVDTALANDTLTLSAEGAGRISVPTASDPAAPLRTVTVWQSEGLQAEDCGPAAAAWLSDFLQRECRLVRIGEKFHRPVLKKAAAPGDTFSFADGAPILVTSEASLADLNDHIQENAGEPVPMDRFRPNLVIAGCLPFAEDEWPRLQIGGDAAPSPRSVRAEGGAAPHPGIILRTAGKSDRCIVTTTDQFTGVRGKEPLKTLAIYRRDPVNPSAVYFGANFINETKRGTLRVGDAVTVL